MFAKGEHMDTVRPRATRKEVAAWLKVSPATLATWAHKGIGPKYTRPSGGMARYDWADVEKWLAEQETGGSKNAA